MVYLNTSCVDYYLNLLCCVCSSSFWLLYFFSPDLITIIITHGPHCFFLFYKGTSGLYSSVRDRKEGRERTGETCSKGSYGPGVEPTTAAKTIASEYACPDHCTTIKRSSFFDAITPQLGAEIHRLCILISTSCLQMTPVLICQFSVFQEKEVEPLSLLAFALLLTATCLQKMYFFTKQKK